MREQANFLDGLRLSSLDTGSVIDLHTRSRRYRIEYLQGNRVRISGHPQWCPTPVHGELPNWPEYGVFEALILLPGCATCSSYSFYRNAIIVWSGIPEPVLSEAARIGLSRSAKNQKSIVAPVESTAR
jgi:hypothetical protein